MPWTLAKLERDKDLIPIPQQWDDRAGKFVPLRVMEYFGNTIDERPLITDVPLGSTYTVVDTQETWQSNGTEWLPKQTKVQLYGTIAPKTEVLLPRAVRTTTTTEVVETPPGAVGFIAILSVWSVSGANRQISIATEAYDQTLYGIVSSTTDKIQGSYGYPLSIWWAPGADSMSVEIPLHSTAKFVSLPLFTKYKFFVHISGEFVENEGVDCELRVVWIW